MDVAIGSSSALDRPSRTIALRWDGLEAPFVLAAWAAAPWPLWCAIAAFGIPGTSSVSFLSGVLALSLVLALMVVWAHRPGARASMRWMPSVIGTGLMGELLAGALTDMGREPLLSRADDLPRAIATWLICVGIYEVAPIVAAGSRLTPREHRVPTLDVFSHLLFVAIAAAAYTWDPRGDAWYVSPWIAGALALPLAAARCGPPRPASLPTPWQREGAIWIMALGAWAIAIAIVIADRSHLLIAARSALRHGIDPSKGVLLALPAWSIVLSMSAAIVLAYRSLRARRAPSGVVVGVSQDAITIERPGQEEPMWVALENGPPPPQGSTVTLLGLSDRPADVGPFRDGAPRLVANRLYVGPALELARSLAHRAGAWIAWGAASLLGMWLFILLLR